uniref:LRA-19 n=1 Tax=uncultured bacterium BLR19 TaxID=506519 RepID=B5L5X0_9BACT|nr:LRA19 family subclass B3 metallo-beta-lactamase [uncultured bacterium BLR19]ACH59005.1 LRA-19 [uncultured bacterium BLR19]
MNSEMSQTSFKIRILVTCLLSIAQLTMAQQVQVTEPPITNQDWVKPYPPFRIVGNLYYVGTYDLACYLIVTPQGNILINTGLASSAPMIEASIKALGFKFSDTKILLTTQAHYDHVGAMAAIKKSTNAQLMIDEKDSPVMADGGSSDYELFGSTGSTYEPVKADRLLKNGDKITLGGTTLVMLHHPGHTKGSCSFLFDVKDESKSYKVLIANMPSIITSKKFSDIPTYPGIAEDYTYTFDAMKKVHFDIWLSSHASQFGMHSKHKPGEAYNPGVFIDRAGYDKAVGDLEDKFSKKKQADK